MPRGGEGHLGEYEPSQGLAIARSPTIHGILPRLEKRFRSVLHLRLAAVRVFPQSAGEEKQFVVAPGIGMQLRQKQPPHASIF